jgi:hypothetical protein
VSRIVIALAGLMHPWSLSGAAPDGQSFQKFFNRPGASAVYLWSRRWIGGRDNPDRQSGLSIEHGYGHFPGRIMLIAILEAAHRIGGRALRPSCASHYHAVRNAPIAGAGFSREDPPC